MSNTKQHSSGISFVGLLTIVFITLKLCGVISWSWWWVLSPLWISFALVVALLIFAGFCMLIAKKMETPQGRLARNLREYGRRLR
ncbi:MAG: hypothetical protein QM627_10175 [Luteolibacter sp.]